MVDAHCHIDLYPSPEQLILQTRSKRVTSIGVTNLPSHYKLGLPHVSGNSHIKFALGLHPLLADQHINERRLFAKLAPSCSFIGEVGLDLSRHGIDTKDVQLESLRFVLKTIEDRPRLLSLHSRGGEKEVLEMLLEFGVVEHSIFHWFTGSEKVLKEAVEAGAYFSVNTAMIASQKGRDLISKIPQEKLLTETDGPHIQIGKRPAMPWDVSLIQDYLTELWDSSSVNVEKQIHQNLRYLFNRLKQDTSNQPAN